MDIGPSARRYAGLEERLVSLGYPVRDKGDVETAVRLLYDSYELQGDAVLRLLEAEDRIPAVRLMTDAGRAWHRDWANRTFAPQLKGPRGAARERRLVRLIVATDLLVWKLLRREMGLSRPTAERSVVEMVYSAKGTK